MFIINLLNKIDKKYKERVISELTKKLQEQWSGEEELSRIYLEFSPFLSEDYGVSTERVSCFGIENGQLTFGYAVAYNSPLGQEYDPTLCVGKFGRKSSAPVLVQVDALGEKELVLPAVVAGYMMNEKIVASKWDFLSQSLGMLMPEVLIKPATLTKWSKFFKGKGKIRTTEELVESTTKLLSSKLGKEVADQIVIGAMYIDDVLGNNKMLKIIEDLIKNPKFKNPEDLLENLNGVYSKGKPVKLNSENLLNEFEEGRYWLDKGHEVIISKKLAKITDEVDVLIVDSKTIIECKNVNGNSFKSIEDNLGLIVDKFTTESKLSSMVKSQYPNHFGKININSKSNPFYHSRKNDFINKIKKGENGISIIGNNNN